MGGVICGVKSAKTITNFSSNVTLHLYLSLHLISDSSENTKRKGPLAAKQEQNYSISNNNNYISVGIIFMGSCCQPYHYPMKLLSIFPILQIGKTVAMGKWFAQGYLLSSQQRGETNPTSANLQLGLLAIPANNEQLLNICTEGKLTPDFFITPPCKLTNFSFYSSK